MISFKKSYAEQLLQLALALSILRVDPDNFLEWGWESRLAGTAAGGWQLELRAAPLTEHPYANRKALSPLIEDLARYDSRHYYYRRPQDVQAYLLNVHSDGGLGNDTAQPSEPSNHNATADILAPDSGGTFETEDLFLNSDVLAGNSTSIIDQNLADLNDYGEIPLSTYPMNLLALKDEPPPDFQQIDMFEPLSIKRERASTSFTSDFGSLDSPNDTYTGPDFAPYFWDEESANVAAIEIKKEIKEETNVTDDTASTDEPKKETNEVISTTELTQEVSFFISIFYILYKCHLWHHQINEKYMVRNWLISFLFPYSGVLKVVSFVVQRRCKIHVMKSL